MPALQYQFKFTSTSLIQISTFAPFHISMQNTSPTLALTPRFMQANFEHVAKQMDMKNPRSIANAWGEIKKKIRDYQTKLPEDLRMPTPAPVDAEGPAAPAGRARSAICRLHGSGRVQKPEGASGAGAKRGRPHKAVAVSATAAAQKLVTPMPSAEDEEAGEEGKE